MEKCLLAFPMLCDSACGPSCPTLGNNPVQKDVHSTTHVESLAYAYQQLDVHVYCVLAGNNAARTTTTALHFADGPTPPTCNCLPVGAIRFIPRYLLIADTTKCWYWSTSFLNPLHTVNDTTLHPTLSHWSTSFPPHRFFAGTQRFAS